jgi:hypothetical protein
MDKSDFSFKNKYVKLWFILVLPLLILSVILTLLLPINYHWIPSYLPVITIIFFFSWYQLDKKKNKG